MKNETIKAIDRFLLDKEMYNRTFNKNSLICLEDIEEYNNILLLLNHESNLNSEDLINSQLNVFYDNLFSTISKFIPIHLEGIEDKKLFFSVFLSVREYHSSIQE
jgi:hypothetical protein